MTASVVWLEVTSTDDFGATGCEAIACTTTGIVAAAWSACRAGDTAVAIVACFEAVATTIVRALIATGLEAAFATARCKAALFAAGVAAWFEATLRAEIAASFRTAFKTRCRCSAARQPCSIAPASWAAW
jgi:hypothetical protein